MPMAARGSMAHAARVWVVCSGRSEALRVRSRAWRGGATDAGAGTGQVLIELRAAGMNPMDGMLAAGGWKPMPATFPMVLGADGAGVGEGLGDDTSRFSVGDELSASSDRPVGSAGNVRRICRG
jgi:NADPH:quinone reductase-like Zn-dependent oxidoreductase